jgi:hypothetical protein
MPLLSGSLVLHFASTQHLFHSPVLGICFGEIMCIRDSYVYQKGVRFFIHKSYITTVRRYCFVRNYATVPVQLEIVILQYIGWCVLVVGTFYLQSIQLLLPESDG